MVSRGSYARSAPAGDDGGPDRLEPSTHRPVRILRIIARLNVGGPAHQVTLLSGRLNHERFETLLVSGHVGTGEGSFEDLAERYGARLERIPTLGPELRPTEDLKALWALVGLMRRYRPDIVHTHTAKAGMLGRLAARLALGRRPIVVHSYHGHVLSGYFGPAKTAVFRAMERGLALLSDKLVGLSRSTVDDLVAMRVAPRERFVVIPTGLDLEPFGGIEREDGEGLRGELGISHHDLLAVYVGRLAPIKRVDVLLEAVAHARAAGAPVRLLVVGDGELREQLEGQAERLGLSEVVTFLGFRRDLPRIVAAGDVAVLSSDNEARPVAMIEAAAAARPVIATAVGGVPEVVTPGTGYLVPPDDPVAMGRRIAEAAEDRSALAQMGEAARAPALAAHGWQRLVGDIEELYEELLSARTSRPERPYQGASR